MEEVTSLPVLRTMYITANMMLLEHFSITVTVWRCDSQWFFFPVECIEQSSYMYVCHAGVDGVKATIYTTSMDTPGRSELMGNEPVYLVNYISFASSSFGCVRVLCVWSQV